MRAWAKTFVNKNAIKSCLGLFQAKVGKFQNGWETFWEFDDICWDFLCFGSSHTDRIGTGPLRVRRQAPLVPLLNDLKRKIGSDD